MFLDSQNQYAAAQVLAATGVSTNIIDHSIDRDIGIGAPLSVLIIISNIKSSAADETYKVQVQASIDAAFTSPLVVGGLVDVPRAIGNNSKVVVPIPADKATAQFSRLSWTLGGTAPTITYTAYLVPNWFIQNENLFASGLRIQ